MVVSNGLFDGLLFGALLLGLGLDAAFPALRGTAFLVACGAAVYMAAQEWSEALARRRFWTQEQLATAVALSIGGFIYFYFRNESDFVILVLSIGLMMASLMVAIATMAAFGAAFKQLSPAPLLGYLATAAGGFAIGALAGLITLETPVMAKFAVLAISFALWKVREALAPPGQQIANASDGSAPIPPEAFEPAPNAASPAAPLPIHPQSWHLMPRRGTLLDRFIPLLLIGGLMILVLRQPSNLLQSVAPPASASNGASGHAPN